MPIKVTGFSVLDSEKEKKKTQKVFVDRDQAIAFFDHALEGLRKEPDQTDIIYYWGVGGIGKSHLINHLFRETGGNPQTYEMVDNKETVLWRDQIRVKYNLDISQNEIEVLFSLRCKLKEEVKKRCQKDFDFLLFDYTLLKYEEKSDTEHKTNGSSNNSRTSNIADLLISEVNMICGKYNLLNPVSEISFVTVPVQLVTSAFKTVFQKAEMRKYMQDIESIEYYNSDRILKKLPWAFAMDVIRLEQMISKTGFRAMPIIIAIDTVERLFYDNPDNVNNPEYDISWLFGKPGAGDTTGLLYTIPSVLWVLCGRDRLNDEVLPGEFQFKLERLDASHVEEVIRTREITASDEIIAAINEVTEGVPAYLDICAELCIEKEDAVTTEDFEGGITRIVNRYMQLMTDTDKENLHLMTSLGQWIDQDFIEISDLLGSFRGLQMSYNRLIQKSFIQSEGESRRIFHNIVREALYSDRDYSDYSKTKNYEAIVSFYTSRVSSSSLSEEDLLYYTDRILFLLSEITDSREKYFLIRPLACLCSKKLETVNIQKSISVYSVIDQNKEKYGLDQKDVLLFEKEYSDALIRSGLIKTATDYIHRLYRCRCRDFGDNAPETLEALSDLGTMYLIAGREDEAVVVLENVLKMRKRICEDDDPQVLDTLSKLADSCYGAHDLEKAKQRYEELYEKYCEVSDEADGRAVDALRNLAGVCHELGEDEEARRLVEKVLDRSALNSEDPRERCQALLVCGLLYKQIGEMNTASDCFEKAYDISRDSFEETDPMTLESLNSLALCYQSQKQFEQAYAGFSELYRKYVHLYGENDHRTIGVLERLASACRKTERFEEASKFYDHLYRCNLAVLGTEHDDTYDAGLKAAECFYALGNDQKALDLYLEILKIEMEKYPGLGIGRIFTSKELVRRWKRFIQYEKGIEFYREFFADLSIPVADDAFLMLGHASVAPEFMDLPDDETEINTCKKEYEKCVRKYGPRHPKTLNSLNSLAESYFWASEFDQAAERFRQLYDFCQQTPEKYHSLSLHYLERIADCYERMKQYDQTLETLRVLYDQRKAEMPDDIETIRTLSRIGDMYFRTGKFHESLTVKEQVYSAYRTISGEDDEQTLEVQLDLAENLFALHQYEDALKTYQNVFDRRVKNSSESEYTTMKILEYIACTYAAMGNLEKALTVQNRYYDLYQENFEVDSV